MNPAWLAVGISAAALVVSSATAGFTVLNITRGQENLSLNIERDFKAGLEPAEMGMIYGEYESTEGLRSHWIVHLSNTSLAASLSVVSVTVDIFQFLGNGARLPDGPDTWSGTKSACSIRGAVSELILPIKLAAGDVVTLECDAKISLKLETAAAFEGGLRAEKNGVYMMFPENVPDMFGNEGSSDTDGIFAAIHPDSVREPHLVVTVKTARGMSYNATGYWYSRIVQEAPH